MYIWTQASVPDIQMPSWSLLAGDILVCICIGTWEQHFPHQNIAVLLEHSCSKLYSYMNRFEHIVRFIWRFLANGILITHFKQIWALTCDFQQCGMLTYVDSNKPVHPTFKLRNSKWYSVGSLILIEYPSG